MLYQTVILYKARKKIFKKKISGWEKSVFSFQAYVYRSIWKPKKSYFFWKKTFL